MTTITATIRGPATNQVRLIYSVNQSDACLKFKPRHFFSEPSEEQEAEGTTEIPKTTSVTKKPAEKDDEYQVLKATFDNNWLQLQAIIKGTNNLEPIYIQCEKDIDAITEDALKAIEGAMILMLNISHTSMNKSLVKL